jgi:site-specific DNA recombinase
MKRNHLQTTKPVGIWIRVSTDEQAQGDSPQHHELRARAYAEAKEWSVREVYDLAGVSGKTVMEHPECKRMMDDVRRGHISGLIFSKLARLARNTIELLKFSEFFMEHGSDLISLGDSIDTSTPAGRMFFTVNAAQAQMEREEIAARVAASVPIRAKLGKPLGGLAPFGYRWDGKKLVPDPKDAPVRKLVYELFAEHKRKKTVARILNERGYRTRGTKSRAGGKFSDTTVTRLIADPTAKGEHRLNYTKSLGEGKKWAVKPEHEWVINKVEAIVTESLWNQCNQLLDARKVKGERPAKKATHAFTGFVRCSCGNTMYVPSNTPKWVCYKCRNKIPIVDLDGLFRDELHAYMVDPGKAAAFVGSAEGGIKEKRDLLTKLQGEKTRAKFEADKCFELYQAGAVNIEQFRQRFQPLDARKQEIDREIPRLEAEIDALTVNELSAEHVISEGQSFYDRWPTLTEDEKRGIVELFLRRIVVGKDDVTVELLSLPCFEMTADGQRRNTGSSRRRA